MSNPNANMPNVSMRSSIAIAPDHPAFAGHFPKFPVLPGAVLLDEALELIRRERGIDFTQWRVVCAKFHGAVRPGDIPCVEHDMPRSGLIRFSIRVEQRIVADGSLCRNAGSDGDPPSGGSSLSGGGS